MKKILIIFLYICLPNLILLSSSSYDYSAYSATSNNTNLSNQIIISSNSDESAVYITQSGITITNSNITKSGDIVTNTEDGEFYGVNAAILVQGGGLTMTGGNITTSGKGANSLVATNGGNVTISGTTIISTGLSSARGLHATYGGIIKASKVNISSTGGSCANLATDRGEGTISCTECKLSTSGAGSPLIYSTGAISVINTTGTSNGAQAIVVEGKNSASIESSSLSCTAIPNNKNDSCGVLIYQSMSGDADSGISSFTCKNSKLEILNSSNYSSTAPMFFVTNTAANINIENCNLNIPSGLLLKVSEGDWGTTGSKGGNVTLNLTNQDLEGNITVDSSSSLTINLINSSITGTINSAKAAAKLSIVMDSNSFLNLTGNSYYTYLQNAKSNNSNIYIGKYTFEIYEESETSSGSSGTNSGTNDILDHPGTNDIPEPPGTNDIPDHQGTNNITESPGTNDIPDHQGTNDITESPGTNDIPDHQGTNNITEPPGTNDIPDHQGTNILTENITANEITESITTKEVTESSTTSMSTIISTDYNTNTDISNVNSTIINNIVIFPLQMQMINKKLKIFMLANHAIPKTQIFTFIIRIYNNTKSSRFLQEDEKMNFTLPDDYYDGNIIGLTSENDVNQNYKAVLVGADSNNGFEVKLSNNEVNYDTEKVKESIEKGGANYSEIASNPSHKIYQYKIASSTEGCDFYINSNEEIKNSSLKNIDLNFIEIDDMDSNITAKCTLSESNKNKIPCKIRTIADNNYNLDPYIYSDKKETITITQSSSSKTLPLKCNANSINSKKNSSGGLSAGGIIAIIFSIVGALIIAGLLYLFIIKKRPNKPVTLDKNSSHLENTTDNINEKK